MLSGHVDVQQVRVEVQIIMKSAEEESIETRVRRCWLASALVALSQGVAFFHAGDEILRSKSLDRDSYNSGAHPISRFPYTPVESTSTPHEAQYDPVLLQ